MPPDFNLLGIMPFMSSSGDEAGMPPAPTPMGGNPFVQSQVWGQYQDPTAANFPSFLDPMSRQVMDEPKADKTTASDPNKLYNYAILASLLGSAGAGLGQAFRPWVRPPQPLPSPQSPQMPITAPAALQALTQTRQARKGY